MQIGYTQKYAGPSPNLCLEITASRSEGSIWDANDGTQVNHMPYPLESLSGPG